VRGDRHLLTVNDVDHYAFTAKKGEKVVVEIFGERQSGPGRSVPDGFDSAGKRIFSADDVGRTSARFASRRRRADARWDFTAPADGEYFVQVRDLYFQQRGEPRFTYRLSVRRPTPDFRLVVVPKHRHAAGRDHGRPPAVSSGWTVLAFRDDGFDEPIRVEATNLPPGGDLCPGGDRSRARRRRRWCSRRPRRRGSATPRCCRRLRRPVEGTPR